IPWAEPLGERFDVATLAVLAITLAIGATSLFWTYMSVSTFWQRLGGNIEARWVLATMVVLGLAYGWLLADAGGRTDVASLLAALGEGLFAAVSLVSTTAIETRPGVIGLLPEIFVLTVVLFGASAFATSGGLKLVRLGALVVHVRRELRLLIYPSSISGSGIAGIRYTPEDIRIIWVPFLLFLAAGSATIFTMTVATGHFESNVVAAFALLANTGGLLPALAPAGVTQAWPLWQDLNAFEHVLCAFVMLLGRLEFLAIFAALNLRYWLGR
ncbi:MAG TPA: hypothetical protein PKE65_05875, partial [Rhizobiaceae bacterium]|nr:hypothetical protein [Rhizobiaceae bacterium]